MSEPDDYRKVMHRVFRSRCEGNRLYSLRAFARDLGMDPSRLSQVMRYRQGISEKVAAEIAKRMRLSPEECERFVLMARATDARSRRARSDASQRLSASEEAGGLRPDVAETLATLERIFSNSAAPAPTEIARSLELSEADAQLVFDRLEQLGLVRK